MGYGFVSGEEGDGVVARTDPVVERREGAGTEAEALVAVIEVEGGDGEMAETDSKIRIARIKAAAEDA